MPRRERCLMPKVETVMGPIDASKLGVTLSHEHVLVGMGDDNKHYPWLYDWDLSRANAIRELSEAKAGGVDTVIDLTTPDLGRDVPRSFWARDLDEIASIFVREITVGIEDTGVKAGAIKVANDMGGVTPEGERILRGAARALRQTGCPISTHHWAAEQVGSRQVEVFLEERAPMERICIGHSADTDDIPYLESLLRTGVYLSMDRYLGAAGRLSWETRNATVKALIDRGWVGRLMLGHDYAPAPIRAGTRAPASSGPTRYLFVSTVAIPALKASGVSEQDIHTMTVDVPRRFRTGVD